MGTRRRNRATTRGGEARLVLPLAHSLAGADLIIEIAMYARGRAATVEVHVNEHLVARAPVAIETTNVAITIPATSVELGQPIEITLRRARPSRLSRRRAADLRVERVRAKSP